MQNDDLQKKLEEMLIMVQGDDGIDEDLKTSLVDLITATASDPTAGNLEALAIVMKKVADANKYMGAMTMIQNIELDDVPTNS